MRIVSVYNAFFPGLFVGTFCEDIDPLSERQVCSCHTLGLRPWKFAACWIDSPWLKGQMLSLSIKWSHILQWFLVQLGISLCQATFYTDRSAECKSCIPPHGQFKQRGPHSAFLPCCGISSFWWPIHSEVCKTWHYLSDNIAINQLFYFSENSSGWSGLNFAYF